VTSLDIVETRRQQDEREAPPAVVAELDALAPGLPAHEGDRSEGDAQHEHGELEHRVQGEERE
jgi:hypothetical protein